jgi:hypothetical protein
MIRQVKKYLAGTLAYSATPSVAKRKSFITLATKQKTQNLCKTKIFVSQNKTEWN